MTFSGRVIGNILGPRRDKTSRSMTQADWDALNDTLMKYERSGHIKVVRGPLIRKTLPENLISPVGKTMIQRVKVLKPLTNEVRKELKEAFEKHQQGQVGRSHVITEVTSGKRKPTKDEDFI
jgi:hypothetical protein